MKLDKPSLRPRGLSRAGVPFLLALVLAGIAGISGAGVTAQQVFAAGSDDWTQYLYDGNHTGYNTNFSAFGTANAGSLTKKWSFTTGGNVVAEPAVATITNPSPAACAGAAVPIAFVGSWNGYLYAFNATSGALCWKTFLAKDVQPTPNQFCINSLGITSSATVANVTINGSSNQVVYAGASDIMFAVDATNGTVLWKTVLAGADVGTFSQAYTWSSPVYSPGNSTLYASTSSFCDETSPVDGTLFALNPATGAINTSHPMLPNNGQGAGIWGTPTVDPSSGTVYVTTGNAFISTPNGLSQACDTSQPMSCAIVAMDWNSLAVKSSWQVPASQFVHDGDFGTTPVLFPGSNGHTWLAAGNKNGRFYVLDTTNLAGGPVWQVKLAGGGSNPIKGIIAPAAFYPGGLSNGGVTCNGGVLFVAAGKTTLNGTAYGGSDSALCAQTGSILWQQGTSGLHWGAPVIANGLVAAQAGFGIEVRDWTTGNLLFSFTATKNMQGAAAFANGRLYIGANDHALYAFGL